jgi:hypothetical protein
MDDLSLSLPSILFVVLAEDQRQVQAALVVLRGVLEKGEFFVFLS